MFILYTYIVYGNFLFTDLNLSCDILMWLNCTGEVKTSDFISQGINSWTHKFWYLVVWSCMLHPQIFDLYNNIHPYGGRMLLNTCKSANILPLWNWMSGKALGQNLNSLTLFSQLALCWTSYIRKDVFLEKVYKDLYTTAVYFWKVAEEKIKGTE